MVKEWLLLQVSVLFIVRNTQSQLILGGFADSGLDSTEILNIDTDSNWIEGPSLPTTMDHFPLINTRIGILAFGGWDSANEKFRNEILNLECSVKAHMKCRWIELYQKMEIGRHSQVVVPLPDSFAVKCTS